MNWTEYTIQSVKKGQEVYPKSLLALRQPPKEIFYRGELSEATLQKTVAIVGSRRMTRYGASVIDKFVSVFATQGITTISGYMYGVDTEVHTKTVEYGGKTVAIMGGGINAPYPSENDKLYTKILHLGGVVLSEYSPETKPKLWTFPERNRIIAALATIGILVVEASEKSGSMITVNYARKLKKRIFAIPGPITSSVSTGTNSLIKRGIAELVSSPEDILGLVNKEAGKDKVPALNPFEKKIYDILKDEEMSVDELAIKLDRSLVEISTEVSMMALRGTISEAGGKYFVV